MTPTQEPTMTEIYCPAGSHIIDIITSAVVSAPAGFTFNDARVEVAIGDSVETVYERWEAEMKRRADAYRKSPAGIDAELRRIAEVAKLQALYDLRMSHPGDLTNPRDAMIFVRDIAESTDHMNVKSDRKAAAAMLTAAGYTSDAHVGDPGPWPSRKLAEYIAGQFISAAAKGPIPPAAASFAERWLAEHGGAR